MSYKTGGTGKGSGVRKGLDVEKFEDQMEKIRKSKPIETTAEVIKVGNKTTYKF
tara:strand:+ start:512 stop:673 length:162 start_codon:yes stop_codon:yes gene_type:complete